MSAPLAFRALAHEYEKLGKTYRDLMAWELELKERERALDRATRRLQGRRLAHHVTSVRPTFEPARPILDYSDLHHADTPSDREHY